MVSTLYNSTGRDHVAIKLMAKPHGSDVFSTEKRSEVMSRIRGSDNRSTERRMAAMLRGRGISGWGIRPEGVFGRPDIFFPQERIAIFLDGCFWHGCEECFKLPTQNRSFWSEKIAKNVDRDRIVNHELKQADYEVIRIWEHDLEHRSRDLSAIFVRIADLLQSRASKKE